MAGNLPGLAGGMTAELSFDVCVYSWRVSRNGRSAPALLRTRLHSVISAPWHLFGSDTRYIDVGPHIEPSITLR